jgi:hypothetical protein
LLIKSSVNTKPHKQILSQKVQFFHPIPQKPAGSTFFSGYTTFGKNMHQEQYWNSLVPEFTVFNLERSLQFYLSAGFDVRFRRETPPFAYIELGCAQIMLEEKHSGGWNIEPLDLPLGRGINFQIEVKDVEAIRNSLISEKFTLYRDIKDSWYAVTDTQLEGQREFLVQDPDGYLLRFAQYLGNRSSVV